MCSKVECTRSPGLGCKSEFHSSVLINQSSLNLTTQKEVQVQGKVFFYPPTHFKAAYTHKSDSAKKEQDAEKERENNLTFSLRPFSISHW